MWLQALLFLVPLLLLLVVLLPLLFLLLPRVPGSRNPFATDTRRPPAPLVTDKAVRRTVVKTVVRRQDGGFFKGPPYPAYPFLMLPELGSPYLANGALSPSGARTESDHLMLKKNPKKFGLFPLFWFTLPL
ncbi:hypothetical protein Nmel_018508 [Mimus melanotis]